MDIYSPEILTSIEHLLYLIHKDSSAVDLIFQAKQKLLLLGIDKRQLDSIINQKNYLLPSVYLAMLMVISARIWVKNYL